jgi:hypothetical protein
MMVKHHTLVGSESEKGVEIMDHVFWFSKENFDSYSRIDSFIDNSVGHLFRKSGGSPGTTNKEYAQLGDPSRLPSGL